MCFTSILAANFLSVDATCRVFGGGGGGRGGVRGGSGMLMPVPLAAVADHGPVATASQAATRAFRPELSTVFKRVTTIYILVDQCFHGVFYVPRSTSSPWSVRSSAPELQLWSPVQVESEVGSLHGGRISGTTRQRVRRCRSCKTDCLQSTT